MRQFRLRSILFLVAVIADSLWAGMQIERARRGPVVRYTVARPVRVSRLRTYTVRRPVQYTTVRTHTVVRPVKDVE